MERYGISHKKGFTAESTAHLRQLDGCERLFRQETSYMKTVTRRRQCPQQLWPLFVGAVCRLDSLFSKCVADGRAGESRQNGGRTNR